MNHQFLSILADGAIFLLILILPGLWIIFTDRFRHSPEPQEYALLFVVAACAGVLLFLPAISIIFAVGLLALGVAWVSAHFSLSGISYCRSLQPARLFPGDEADLILALENRKLLPLAWLTLADPIHLGVMRGTIPLQEQIQFSAGIDVLDTLGLALINKAAIGPAQTLTRTYRVKGLMRGVYTLQPSHLESGDPFGIFRRKTVLGEKLEILVYPRIYTQEEVNLPFRMAIGEIATRPTLHEDPTLLAGSREYRPGDPLRRMHWKATARTGDLQVRVFDPSTTAQIMILLNLNTFQHVWQGVDPDRMEAVVNVAASLAHWAARRGYAVGLRSNGIVAGIENTPRIAPSAHPGQTAAILEHLARLSFSGRFPPEDVMVDEARHLQRGTSVVFVTPMLTPELIVVLTSRLMRGRVSVVYCGRFAAPLVQGLPIHLATPPLEPHRAVS